MIDVDSDTGLALFQRVTRKLKVRVGPEVYSSWFGRIKLDEASKSVVRLSVPTTFLRSWINSHYLAAILLKNMPKLANHACTFVHLLYRGDSLYQCFIAIIHLVGSDR